jgi:hypothetical protein
MTSLTTKFKYERQKLTDPTVLDARRKFASKRPRTCTDSDNRAEANRQTRIDVS